MSPMPELFSDPDGEDRDGALEIPGAARKSRADHDAAAFAGNEDRPPGPVNWNALGPEEAAVAWAELDAWVSWLRVAYGISALEIPPLWHRHDELVWELSALHQHWLACYGDGASGSAPLAWHKDFDDARHRLRRWVAASGTQPGTDRPTLVATWPGEAPHQVEPAHDIVDRYADFTAMVRHDLRERQDALERFTSPLSRRRQAGREGA
ncbi:hypothetical protein [Isoptericola sp. NPDC019482]|uniref:hypothetical protein n=1 Tax=Isoptericola sp. NPDC019482 TaxID=3154688 RepID=UPI003487034F